MPELQQLIDDLVAANHILYHHGVVDGYGHASIRHPEKPDRFLIAAAIAPGRVQASDILELDLDGNTVDGVGRPVYSERFIHAEVYRARSDVNAVIHSHSPTVIPFSVTDVPLRPIINRRRPFSRPATIDQKPQPGAGELGSRRRPLRLPERARVDVAPLLATFEGLTTAQILDNGVSYLAPSADARDIQPLIDAMAKYGLIDHRLDAAEVLIEETEDWSTERRYMDPDLLAPLLVQSTSAAADG